MEQLQYILRHAGQLLRSVFKQRWFQRFNTHWQNSPQQIQQLLANPYIADFCSSLSKFQREKFKEGDIEQWEIPLLIKVLTSVDLSHHSTINFIQDQNKKIQKLSQIRNFLAHNAKNLATDKEFQEYLSYLIDFLLSAGESQDSIDRMKYLPVAELTSAVPGDKELDEKVAKLKAEGNACFGKGEYDKAIKIYTEALLLGGIPETERAVLYSNRAASYLKLNTNEAYTKALADSKQAIENWPGWAKGYIRKGIALSRLGRYEKAIAAYDTAIALDPKNKEIQDLRAEALDYHHSLLRNEHLESQKTMEDHFSQFAESFGKQLDTPTIKNMIKMFKKSDSAMHDFLMGQCFLHGLYVLVIPVLNISAGYAQDDRRALELFSSAAKAGNANAMYYMGYMARYGRGQQKDPAAAIVWWKKAAKEPASKKGERNAGVAEAEHALGNAYMDGIGVKQDVHKARLYFEASAEHGFDGALNNLGTLYEHGQGVARDMNKAAEYYTAAAMKGNSLAMYNLGAIYMSGDLGRPDINKARMWLQRAAEAGFQRAEIELQKLENYLEDHPNANENELPEKMKKLAVENPSIKNLGEAIRKGTQKKSAFQQETTSELQQMATCLPQYSSKSIFAKNLNEAFELFVTALSAIVGSNTTPQLERQIITNIAKCYRYPNGGIAAHWIPQALQKVLSITERLISKNNEDEDAMVCYLWAKLMMGGDSKWAANYCNQIISVNPRPVYYNWMGDLKSLGGQYERAAQDLNKAISLETDPVYLAEFYFSRASCKRMIEAYDSSIEDYNKFLELADAYHRKVPETYYWMAWMYMTRDKQAQMKRKKGAPTGPNMELAKQFYQKAKLAEKTQLPIFPTDCGCKDMLDALFQVDAELNGTKNTNGSSSSRSSSSDNNNNNATPSNGHAPATPKSVSIDPLKLEMMRNQRQAMHGLAQTIGQQYQALFKHESRQQQKMPKNIDLTSLKPITVEEMDPRKDKVYNGRILTGTLVESPFPMTGIHSVIQDDQGHCARISFYNVDDAFKKSVLTKLAVGRRLSIVNPYLRIAADMKSVVRVDDPLTIIFLSPEGQRVCFTCLKTEEETHLLNCSACKLAWYCSKECQSADWKQLDHKSICGYLKNFKEIVLDKTITQEGTISFKQQ